MMRWESVQVNARARETPDGKKSAGRTGGIWGPGRRWGHTCNAVKGGRFLYVFGGYGSDNCQTNDVHVFDTVKQAWSKPMMKGIPPSPRDSHSCTTVGNRLFVFGGTDGNNPLKDLHILDTTINTWIVPAVTGEGPAAREGHSATLIDKRLFIFGGCGKSSANPEEIYYNDLYILDTENLVWKFAITSGIPPCARDSHTCSAWKNKIIVLGGEDSSDYYLSDVYMLDTETLVWKQINTSGEMLAPRAGHTTVALGSNLFVFGGFTDARNLYDDLHVLNVDSGTWSKVVPANQGPSARFSVAGDCLDEQKGIIVFIGGCNRTLEALDDMYYLHTGMPVGNGLSELRQEKSSLKRELKKRSRENYLSAEEFEQNNDVRMPGVRPESSQPVNFEERSQAGTKSGDFPSAEEVTFKARVVDLNQYGYTIETIINGRLLRGMLLSCTASSSQDNHGSLNKRMASEVQGPKLIEHRPAVNTVPTIPQGMKSLDHVQTAGAYGKESALQGSRMEVSASGLANSSTSAGHPNLAAENVAPSSVPSTFVNDYSENLEPSTVPSQNMEIDAENLGPSTIPSGDKERDSKDLDVSPMPSEDQKNDSENVEPSLMPSENPENDLEKLVTPSVPLEELKNASENAMPMSSLPSEDTKNYEILDVPRERISEQLCETAAADQPLPPPSSQDAEEFNTFSNERAQESEGKQNG